ncbi:MAG: D-Ala-D-Ala carboxypeptidase family metallohydrolase [Pseudomonadota bacterium]
MLPMSALVPAAGHNPDLQGVRGNVKQIWERVQKRFGQDLPITSGYRDAARNQASGGAKGSQHLHGNALDIDVSSLSNDDRLRLIRLASAEGFNGVGVYNNTVHFDVGGRRAWGPTHGRNSVPAWAEETISQHLGDGFQLAEATPGHVTFDAQRYQQFKEGRHPRPAQQEPAKQGGFDPARYEQLKRSRLEPTMSTQAPAAPEGMDAQPDPSLFQRAVGGVQRAIVGDAEFDAPEIEGSLEAQRQAGDPERQAAFRRALFAADGEKAMAQIVKRFIPDAQIIEDKNGNLYADVAGERYALDKSGLSGRDATELVKLAGAALIVGGAARAGGAVAGTAGRITGAGIGAGAEQTGEQLLSNYMGGDQPFDSTRVALAAAFGLGGETAMKVAEFAGPKLLNALGRTKGSTVEQVEIELLGFGFDPDEVRNALNGALQSQGVKDFGEDAIARIVAARSMEPSIELTAGQATRDPALFAKESVQRSTNALGTDIHEQALAHSQRQQASLAQNAQRLVPDGDRASRGAMVQDELLRRREAAWQSVDVAYAAARNAPGQARIAVQPIQEFIDGMRLKTRQMAVPSGMPMTAEALSELEGMLRATGPGRITALDVRQLEMWRSQLSGTMNGAQGSDRAGLSVLARNYDVAMSKAFKDGVVRGDAKTLGLWRAAATRRRIFGERFEQNDIVGRLTRQAKGRRNEVELDASDVMGEILGMTTLGNRKGAVREIRRLKNFLGEDSPQFAAIKAQGIVQLLGFEPHAFAGGNVPTSIVGNIRRALKDRPEVITALYSPNELRALRRFENVVESINVPPRDAGTVNASGSGVVALEAASKGMQKLERALEVIGRQFGTGGRVVAHILSRSVRGASDAAQADAMRRSFQGLPPVQRLNPAYPGLGGTAGGTVGGEFGE